MSRYYIYDSVTDSVAEFATSYGANSRKSSQYRGKEGGRRPRPKADGGLSTAEIRVTGSGQNPMGKAKRGMSKGGGLALNNPAFRSDQANSDAFKKMTTKKLGSGKLLLGAGALAAGLGGAYLGAKALKNRKQEKQSIKGRIKSLLRR